MEWAEEEEEREAEEAAKASGATPAADLKGGVGSDEGPLFKKPKQKPEPAPESSEDE